jgi:hypothetical protein
MNPFGKIPILEHGDLTLPDSSVICACFERLHPEPSLYPKDPGELALALWYEEYSETKLVEVATPIVFERVVKRVTLRGEPDEARVADTVEKQIPPVIRPSRVAAGRRCADSTLLSQSRTSRWALDFRRSPRRASSPTPHAGRSSRATYQHGRLRRRGCCRVPCGQPQPLDGRGSQLLPTNSPRARATAPVGALYRSLDAREAIRMCRNIKTLFNFEPPVTDDEIHAAALQFVAVCALVFAGVTLAQHLPRRELTEARRID